MTNIPHPNEKHFYKKWWFWILIVLAIIIAASVIIGFYYSSQSQFSQYDYLQEAVTVEKRDLKKIVTTNGTIKSDQTTNLTMSLPGTVTELNYAVGDDVNKDDVILKIDAGSYVSADNEELKAPFDGRILGINTFVGDQIVPTLSLIEIGYRSTHIEFYASESEVIDLEVDQTATFTVPSINGGDDAYDSQVTYVDVKKYEAGVSLTGQSADTGYLTKLSVGNLPDEYAKIIGLTVDVEILVGQADDVTSLEIAAVQYDDDKAPFVYLIPTIDEQFVTEAKDVEDVTELLIKKSITTGFRGDEYIQVSDGLRDGDEVLMYIPQSASNSFF